MVLVRSLCLVIVLACAGPGRALAADAPVEKIPANLKRWQVLAEIPQVPKNSAGYPFRVFDDGTYECELMDNRGNTTIGRGRLSDADRSAILTMYRAVAMRSGFAYSGGITWDIASYEFEVASGSRSIRVVMELDRPTLLGISGEVTGGLQVVNRVIRSRRNTREFSLPMRVARVIPSQPGVIVPAANPDWHYVWMKFILPNGTVRIAADNPHKEGGRPDVQITRATRENRHWWVPPQSYPLSDEDRGAMFRAVRDIVNGFALSNDDVSDANALPRCKVAIGDEGKSYSVEFPIDDRLPKEWLAHIRQVSLIGHRGDKTLPVFLGEPGQAVGGFDGQPITRVFDAELIDDDEMLRLFAAPVWEKFRADHKAAISARDGEIDAFVASERARIARETEATRAERRSLEERMLGLEPDDPLYRELRRKLEHLRKRLWLPSMVAARTQVEHWKAQRTLYDEFGGGDVVLRGDGLEAIDAEQEMLSRAIRDKRLVIPDQTLRERVLGYYAGVKKSSKVLTAEEKESQFLSPAWAKGADGKRPE